VKILAVVEDDEDMRLLIRMRLQSDDRLEVVSEAATAAGALEATGAHRPDLVILDHFILGEIMGLQVAPLLKAASPTTKILLFTDHDFSVEAARDTAIDAYLPKSRLKDLLLIVRSLLLITDPGAKV